MSTQIIQTLEQAVDGLLYMSETDEPFEVVHWPGDGKPLDANKLLELASYKPGTPVKTLSVGDFLKNLTEYQRWYGNEEKATADKYKNLKSAIEQNLSNARVFKVGEIQVDIYIIGMDSDGSYAGVKTAAVET